MTSREKVVHKAIMTNTTLERIIDTTMEDFDLEDCMEVDITQIKRGQEFKSAGTSGSKRKKGFLLKDSKKFQKTFGWDL